MPLKILKNLLLFRITFLPRKLYVYFMQKMHSILPSTIYQLYITVFSSFLVTFFPRKKRLFSTWESFSKTAILHACKSITLCKHAQKFGRLSSENLSSYLKTFFKRNVCLRYKKFNLLSYTISYLKQKFNLILPLPCQHNTFSALIIRLLLKTRIHKINLKLSSIFQISTS